MKKVLIIDDEVQIRKGLRMKVNWVDLGLEILGEASNGLEALSLLERQSVDIVVTDVKMPVMDGIEFVKHCHQNYPTVKIIVLSGYNEFEYARSAMREGVKHYLLKPVAPNELADALEKVRTELDEEFTQRKEAEKIIKKAAVQKEAEQEQFLLQLVKEDWIERSLPFETIKQLNLEHFQLDKGLFQFISVEIRDSNKNPHKAKELWMPFRMLCREIAKEHKQTYSFYDPQYRNMIHFVHLMKEDSENSQKSIVRKITHYVNTYMKLEVVIGVGKAVSHYKNMKNGYRSSLLSWSQSDIGLHSQIIDETVHKEMFKFTPDLEKKIINSMESNKRKVFEEQVSTILGKSQTHSILSYFYVSNRLLFLLSSYVDKYGFEKKLIKQFIWNCQQSIWELNSQNRVKDTLIQLGNAMMDQIHKTRVSVGVAIVDDVRFYLEEHYGEEISLTMLSEQFHINSAYLSELFKMHIGENFSDYLLHLRMTKAIDLLQDDQLKIIDVAQLVGFSNSGYFSTVFKKYFGQTPADFRKSAI
ncbi:response regulator transcription factor [Niallia sp. 01092]|uniref:response regulator transcription factor n=1 Tax=unclassified Niallia TaxID=2837522 RepID=UPI003FD67D21